MRNDLIVSGSVIINANQNKVWKGLTDPGIIKKYLFGTETLTDWKVGSEIAFQGEYQGQKYRDHGFILETIPEKKLSYSYWSSFTGLEDKKENYSVVTYKLTKLDDFKTEFTWEQKGFANEEGYKHSLDSMDSFLNQVKEIIEEIG